MSIYMLKMGYHKELANYLNGHLQDPNSLLNRSVLQQGGTLLSMYQTQAGKDLIFLLEGSEKLAQEMQQIIIRQAPQLFKSIRCFDMS